MFSQTDEKMNEIVRRIVRVANPRRIVLFGSRASGTAGPDSDVDLLVIVSGPVHRRRLAQEIHIQLIGAEYPVDVIVYTEEDVERFRTSVGVILPFALAEGKEIYAA